MCAPDAFHTPRIGPTPRCAGSTQAGCGQFLKFSFHSADTPLNRAQDRRHAEEGGILFPRPTSGLQFRFGKAGMAWANETSVPPLAEAFG